MTPAYIFSIGTAVPSNKFSQEQACNFMRDFVELNRIEALTLRQIYRYSGINFRHTVIDDFLKPKGEYSFFPNTSKEPEPPISRRMELYEKHAIEICNRAVSDCLSLVPRFDKKNITHVVTFSCTGMFAPGLDIKLVENFELNLNVERTCINFMGCYAGINALKTAYHIIRSQPDSKILLAGVELCTLHYRHSNNSDQMMANAIFSDGASAVLVSAEDELLNQSGIKLELKTFYSEFASEGRDDMVWSIADYGFKLKLSGNVPKMIKQEINTLIRKLFDRASLTQDDISYYAIHPGGVKVLEACEEALLIAKEQNHFSYDVLKNYGNMSSVTVLFVLKKYLKGLTAHDKGKNLLSCAFGPGLTMESMILQVA